MRAFDSKVYLQWNAPCPDDDRVCARLPPDDLTMALVRQLSSRWNQHRSSIGDRGRLTLM